MQGSNPKTQAVVPDPSEQVLYESGLPLPEPKKSNILPPGGGEAVVPHYQTFSMLVNSMSRVYRWTYDEALRHSQENALAIRRDPIVMDALRSRQIPVCQLPWHLESEDDQDEQANQGIKLLTASVKAIPRLQQLLMHLEEGIYFGRYGVQEMMEWDYSSGKKQLHIRDHKPINGDKLIFRWSGEAGILVHAAYPGSWQVTDRGRAHFFTPEEREQILIHRFEPEDADYFEGDLAGGINGVGIRSRIYWLWYLRQQVMSFLMDYLERVGAGGFTVYYYEAGNPQSLKNVQEAAEAQWRNNAILFPRNKENAKGNGPGVENIPVSTAGAQLLQALITTYFDDIIRRYILGQSLTSEAEGSGLGGSGVAGLHADTFARIIKYDAVNLQETLTTDLIRVLQKYNCPQVRKPIRWVFEIDKPNASEVLEAASAFYEMGGTVDEDELRGTIGLSKPVPGSSMLAKFQGMNPAGMAPGQAPEGVPMLGTPGPEAGTPVPGGGPLQAAGPPQGQPMQMAKTGPHIQLAHQGDKAVIETPERREAREAQEAYVRGEISLYEYLKAQLPGFRIKIGEDEFVNSFDRGPMRKVKLPVSAYQGSAIGQTKLYSPKQLASYQKFLEENPEEDTEPIVAMGDETGYSVYDGHHRQRAYENAKRTHIPAWRGVEAPAPDWEKHFKAAMTKEKPIPLKKKGPRVKKARPRTADDSIPLPKELEGLSRPFREHGMPMEYNPDWGVHTPRINSFTKDSKTFHEAARRYHNKVREGLLKNPTKHALKEHMALVDGHADASAHHGVQADLAETYPGIEEEVHNFLWKMRPIKAVDELDEQDLARIKAQVRAHVLSFPKLAPLPIDEVMDYEDSAINAALDSYKDE